MLINGPYLVVGTDEIPGFDLFRDLATESDQYFLISVFTIPYLL